MKTTQKPENSEYDSARYKRAFKLALKNYWRITRGNWKVSFPGLFMPSLNNILIAYVPPLAVAGIVSKATDGQQHDFQDFLPYIGVFALSWFVAEVIMRVAIHFMIVAEIRGVTQLYDEGLSNLLKRDSSFFHDNFAGSLTKKTLGYANRYIDTFDTLGFSVFYKLLPIAFAAIVLATYSIYLSAMLIGWLAFALIVVTPLIKKRRDLVTVREISSNVVSGHIADVYGNVDAVRAHATEKAEEKRNRYFVDDMVKKTRRSWDFQNLRIDMTLAPIFLLSNVSGLVLGVYLAQQGVIEFAALIVVFSYYIAVTSFMWEFNNVYRRLEAAISDAAQYTELLLTEPTVTDADRPIKPTSTDGAISFNKVHFAYDDNSDQLFTDFSFDVAAGEKIGLVGRSGGGKSSITKLLLRFSDIDSGAITIDGVDISKMKQADLRGLISYVPQDPAMFHRTIRENIAYGRPEASSDEVIDAAKKAHAHEFIKDLPDGYETLVGERGVKLSGGQRQRIAIARALLRNAPILLLDEATSALDSESEKLIQDALWTLMEGKTSLVIAHRLSTIQHMDRIIVLDKGEIVESGNHKELLDQKGHYAKLWAHQSGGFLED